MRRRVRITGMPKAESGLESKMHNLRAGLGFNANTMPWPIMAGKLSKPPLEVNNTLKPVPRKKANLEAEKDEVAAIPTKSGIPDTKVIGGKRHYEGGTPLNLPVDSFIFSDTAKMRIKDPVIQQQFGMPVKKNGYTPAEIAKKYNVSLYKKILADRDADVLQQKTAEMMISNNNMMLAKLALVQESMKGFPQGIPAIAQPYVESMNLDPKMFEQMNPGGESDDQTAQADMMGRYGKEIQLPKAQNGVGGLTGFINKLYSSSYDDFQKKYKPWWDAYKNALNSKNPELMRDIADKLDEYNVEGSWGWIHNSDQDKFQNLAGVLRKEIDKLNNPTWKDKGLRWESQEKDVAAETRLKETKNKLNEKIKSANKNSPEYLDLIKDKEALDKLPIIEGTIPKGKIEREPGLIFSPGNMYTPVPYNTGAPVRYYEDDDVNLINSYYNKYFEKAKPKNVILTEPGKGNVNVDTQTVNTPVVDSGTAASIRSEIENYNSWNIPKETQVATPKKSSSTGNKATTNTSTRKRSYKQESFGQETKKFGGDTGRRRVVIKSSPVGMYKSGGAVLQKMQTGGEPVAKREGDVYPVEWIQDPTTQEFGLKWSDGQITNKQKIEPSIEQHKQTRELIKTSAPTKEVTQEDYDKLIELYEKAKAKDPTASAKVKTKEAEEFQKLYHKILPHEAQRIIAEDPEPTGKCKGTGDDYYSFECNEDGYFGRRTVKYMENLKKIPIKKKDEIKDTPGTTTTTTTTTTPTTPVTERLKNTRRYPPVPPSPWVQDVNNLNQAFLNWANVKGYFPYSPPTNVMASELFFKSPERALAENQSQMNMAANLAARTRSPQDFYGTYQAISGKGFENAANVIGQVQNQNIDIANQQAMANAAAYNQNAALNAQRQTQLYDQTNATLQNIQATKEQRANEFTKAKNALITNMANKYNINLLNPQYAVDPYGMIFYHDPRELKPEDQQLTLSQRYQKILNENPVDAKDPEGRKRLWEMAKIEHGVASTSYDDPTSDYERNKRKGVTPYMQYPS